MSSDPITMKVLTVADLHQSKTLYEQLETAVRWHSPDVVAVIGDCLDLCEAIERYSPLLTVSGHDHETPVRRGCWWEKVGRTVCLNVGQKLDGPLHYCVLEFTFPQSTPSLPSRIRVSAYPWDQSLEIGLDGSAQ